jgi:hypothetical protein
MYHTLARVIMRRDGEGKQEAKPCNTREPKPTKSGEDRSQRLILHRPVRVKLHQGVGPLPWCTAAGSE